MMEEISIVNVPSQWVLGMCRKGRYGQIAPMIMADICGLINPRKAMIDDIMAIYRSAM